MADDGIPTGKRFTHVYSERGKPTQDSQKMRRRLASLIDGMEQFHASHVSSGLDRYAEGELGIEGPYTSGYPWRHHLAAWELEYVFDLVTVGYRFLVENSHEGYGYWCDEVRRIFQEENVHYTVDDEGGVHFQPDEQFAKDRAATIANLQGNRYANARHAFEGAMQAFSKAPPDGKYAVRGVFSAAENVFKLITSKDRLGAKEADDLGPIIDKLYATDDTARNSARKMLASLKDWVDAAHFYRHEPGTEDVAQPPLALAVYLVSTGASHLRWLAELDAIPEP
jgi:hypothetical protein